MEVLEQTKDNKIKVNLFKMDIKTRVITMIITIKIFKVFM